LRGKRGAILAAIGALVFAAAMAWLLVPAIGGSDLIDPLVFDGPAALVEDRTDALVPLIIGTLAGLAGLSACWVEGESGEDVLARARAGLS